MQVSVQYAQEHFADLLAIASKGEEVDIALAETTLRLTISPMAPKPKRKGPRILGEGIGEMIVPTEEEWRAMDKELEHLMNDGQIFPEEGV